ncbi:hypothetical protein TEA_007936 [Camellia sinensis var. sinensis]|uniref:Xylose isomerase n=1 Tax=Camellia sinensis var. sinensis TaxID=542762 RepID=A0A4V3WNK9_CAMSN|nr:hypothetical protein TEA_007936 [Camellia sinensis var. sinensis]
MKTGKFLVFILCLHVSLAVIAASPQTCPANIGKGCGDDWEGEFFPGIPKIKYEGPSSKSPLAFKWYNGEEEILGKKMKDWMRFSVAFWHTFRGTGGDPFGAPTKMWPWEDGTNSVAMAKRRMRANFEFIDKLGVELWCFHDRDIAPDGATLEESNANLDEVVALAKELQGKKIHPLWGTSQLFMHPRYMHGGATSSELGVYAYAAAQVKKAMEVTHYLGGENYVFWGGREGYQTLLNTDMERELNHMARFLEAAVAYKKKIGFNGEFKLNIECNHATLSGHSCHHELETARINGLLGNIDANTGDPQIGWDTDQFLTDIGEATMVMLCVVRNGGLAPGGFNFDAKLRRESTDVEDLFIAHISGMDTLARGLRNVAKLIEDGSLAELVRKRYQSFDTELGALIEAGKADFEQLEKKAMEWGEPKVPSAKQEWPSQIRTFTASSLSSSSPLPSPTLNSPPQQPSSPLLRSSSRLHRLFSTASPSPFFSTAGSAKAAARSVWEGLGFCLKDLIGPFDSPSKGEEKWGLCLLDCSLRFLVTKKLGSSFLVLTMLEKPQFSIGFRWVRLSPQFQVAIGFNVETVQYNNIKFQVWDLGFLLAGIGFVGLGEAVELEGVILWFTNGSIYALCLALEGEEIANF